MAAPVKPDPAHEAADGGDGPKLSPLEQALADARARRTEGKSIIPKAEEKKEPAGEGDDAGGDDDQEEGDAQEGAKAEDQDAAGDDETDEGEEADEDEGESAEASGDDEGGEEGDTEDEDEEVDPELVVQLPPRREGDPEIEIVAESKETAEALRRLKNQAVRGRALEERESRVQQDQAQIEELEVFIGTDPVGFIEQNVPDEVAETVALSLITNPELLQKIKDRLYPALQDSKEMRTLRAELKAERAEARGHLKEVLEVRRFAKEQAKVVRDTLQVMVPETDGISGERRQAILETLERAVGAAVRDKKIQKIEPDDLPVILTRDLRAAGIDPLGAAQAIKNGGKPPQGDKPGKSPAKPKGKRPTAKELKEANQKRKKAAASAPPGASAPASRPKLPQGQTLEDRFKLVREKGIGALLTKG